MRRWMPRTLRVRLTGWYVAMMIVVLGLYAGAVLAIVARNASRALDARLRSDFRWAAGMAERRPDGALSWFEGDPWREDSPWLQVWTPDGRLLYRTAVARRLPVPASERLLDRADGSIVRAPGDPAPFRVLGRRTVIGDAPVIIQVGRSEALLRQELGELALVLLLGLPLSVAAAGIGGYALACRALAPLDRMAARARAITAARLGDRLPVGDPADELGRLAAVFNTMLGRLESSFAGMRRFTANVSHELRTPLTAIRSVGEVGLRGPRDAAAYRVVIESLLEEADHLTCLVDQLLTVSRAEGDRQRAADPIDLGALADQVAAHLGVLAEEKRLTLTVERHGRPACRGDRVVLRQAVINLVDNAIRYTPAGGAVRLRAGATADGEAMLEVCDTGPGVPAHHAPQLFDRLHRARGDGAADAGGPRAPERRQDGTGRGRGGAGTAADAGEPGGLRRVAERAAGGAHGVLEPDGRPDTADRGRGRVEDAAGEPGGTGAVGADETGTSTAAHRGRRDEGGTGAAGVDEPGRGARRGAGLGLAIARWAVEVNRGRLGYERPPGRGSTFRITLPLHVEDPPPVRRDPPPPAAAPRPHPAGLPRAALDRPRPAGADHA